MRLCLAVPVLLAGLTGCGDDGHTPTATPDAPPDAASVSYGTRIPLRFPAKLIGTKDFPTTIKIDTDTSSMCDPASDKAAQYCAITGATITIDAGVTVSASGTKPLVFVADQTITLDGTIDVSSRIAGSIIGAGAQPSCAGATAATGSSGGYGGSFGGKGGAGGLITGGTGGVPATPMPPDAQTLLGGCPGGTGAATDPTKAGLGGAGGGAVLLSAPTISFNGIINASGAAGTGGLLDTTSTGAGGGGSGGMIVLDGTITPGSASPLYLFANGGGGGQGGTASGSTGASGHESTDPNTAATGGTGSGMGGPGGIGSFGPSKIDGARASAASGSGGGGAGGGGAGIIHTPEISGAVVAPPAT